jgi:5-methyltetrahydrofolate--homocysteine methyltransferase
MADLNAIAEAIFAGKADPVKQLCQEAINEGVAVERVLNEGLIKGMERVGVKFKANEIYVPEVLIAARAMKAGMEILKPILADKGVKPIGTVIIGTVKGDRHDIGKNLVSMMLEGAGFEVIDLGIDIPHQKFVDAAKESNAKVIGMSALLTTTMMSMKDVVAALKESGLKVKTIIGGAPVTDDFAREIGASGYAPDAASAVDVIKELMAS